MNITPIGYNNQGFKGSLIVNNLKNKKIETFMTDKKMDKHIRESFNNIISEHMFVMRSQKECLTNLKECVSKFSEILGKNIGKDLKYPSSVFSILPCFNRFPIALLKAFLLILK